MKSLIIVLICLVLFSFCSENKVDRKQPAIDLEIAKKYGLTEFEYLNGIGPIKEKINFGEIDKEKVKLGKSIYNNKCTTCHMLDKRYVAPPLIVAINTRSDEFILNMILNPEEMVKRHPEMMKQFAIYAKVMTNFEFSIEEATNILHYMKFEAERKKK